MGGLRPPEASCPASRAGGAAPAALRPPAAAPSGVARPDMRVEKLAGRGEANAEGLSDRELRSLPLPEIWRQQTSARQQCLEPPPFHFAQGDSSTMGRRGEVLHAYVTQ